ncbi:hypothetical protein [Acidicapsa acidisoli]|uniref:hypothetical protein n=1 Tax=Acidicapsa acidisoli TaxID=1615681 RepID=UPI0021E096D2|nr:hypothetical protein [Acidicapsa acidisoli]
MKLWQKLALLTLVVVLIGSARFYFVWKSRQNPGVMATQGEKVKPLTQDELAVVTEYYFASFDQAKRLEGKPVWIKAGYSLPYYPYAGGQVQFGRRVGELPAAEKLSISKLIKAVAPAKEDNRVPHGTRQYFAVFTLDGNADAKPGTFAAPIGYVDGANETLYCDQLFYYDDPRTIYDNWPKPVWDAVAAHEPKVGMTENQTRMAVGILMESSSQSQGDRTVTYHAGPKTWTVTFAKGVATQVKAG